jgi:molybdopterin synthase catalytic subunit
MIEVKIQKEAFNSQEILQNIESKKLTGAMVTFIGSVRGESLEKNINNLFIEHYESMAANIIKSTAKKAVEKWNLSYCYVIHRYGNLKPSESIVMVVTCSKHRKESYAANEFIIDWLKTNAPFWKKEEFDEGSRWVEQND